MCGFVGWSESLLFTCTPPHPRPPPAHEDTFFLLHCASQTVSDLSTALIFVTHEHLFLHCINKPLYCIHPYFLIIYRENSFLISLLPLKICLMHKPAFLYLKTNVFLLFSQIPIYGETTWVFTALGEEHQNTQLAFYVNLHRAVIGPI